MALVLPLFAWACQNAAPPEESADAGPPVDSVALAAAAIGAGMFDSISWADDNAAIERGALVWSISCAKCHGTDGAGGGEFAKTAQWTMPSLLEGDWPLAQDPAGLRKAIYTGTQNGMPHWGLHGLKPRDVDAVAIYIELMLRG